MTVSNDAYSLLEEKFRQIESTATGGILQQDARDCCMAIRNLVFEIRQIVKNEFYLEPTDGRLPPAA